MDLSRHVISPKCPIGVAELFISALCIVQTSAKFRPQKFVNTKEIKDTHLIIMNKPCIVHTKHHFSASPPHMQHLNHH